MILRFQARDSDAGRKVYNVLKGDLCLSATQIKRLKAADAISVNGLPVFVDRRLAPGETLEADLDACERAPEFPAETGPVEVLFENEAILALNKPAGMLTHPSRGQFTGTLANLAAGYLAERGSCGCHAVNRLDRDTSGVTVFAKSAHFKALTAQALHGPGAEKVYVAILSGVLPEDRGVIDLPIDREREGFQRRVVRETGKRAVTEYETAAVSLLCGRPVSLVHLSLKTGRTHQIRVHCSHLGCPVLGDRLYADDASRALSDALDLPAHLLHARRITLPDPLTALPLTVTAPVVREDMIKTAKKLKLPLDKEAGMG